MRMEIYCQDAKVHAARRAQGGRKRQAIQNSRRGGHSSAKA